MRLGLLLSVCALLWAGGAIAQNGAVQWKYSAVQTGDGAYELHVVATIDEGWHIYSQTTPEGGANPTVFKFNNNPLLTLVGKVKEKGALKMAFENVFNLYMKYYVKKVEFVQAIKVKGKIKTNISGTISYMICTDETCLPPAIETFNVKLN